MVRVGRHSFVPLFTLIMAALPLTVSAAITCPCAHRAAVFRTLYDATNGATWVRPWDMSSEEVPCGLEGVTCDPLVNDITFIALAARGLSGTLPSSLGDLIALKSFGIVDNTLTGTLPSSLSQWTQLEVFSVDYNIITGTLPSEFSAWSHIVTFGVGANKLTGTLPSSYSTWIALSVISLAQNFLTGTLPLEYSSWTNITTVHFWLNQLSGTLPESYKSWVHLTQLNIDANSLSGTLPPEYASWIELTVISTSANSLSGTLPVEYSAWSQMTNFKLSNNALIGTLPAEYASWNNLTVFDIGANAFSGTLPPQYSVWSKLTTFSIMGNRISGTLPKEYSSWTLIQQCLLRKNSFVGTLPPEYSAWVNVRTFDTVVNLLSGTIPPQFSVWKNVTTFIISGNFLSGTLPPEFSVWTLITVFNASKLRLSGTIPSAYRNWSAVLVFAVSNNNLSGTFPPELGEWKNVTLVDISWNRLSGTLPSSLSSWWNLTQFYTSNNTLTGTLPPQFSVWRSITQFDVSTNRIEGTLPMEFSSWVNLDQFKMPNNFLTGTLPPQFTQWRSITYFDVSTNRIEGTLPMEYSSWVSLNKFTAPKNLLTGTLPPQWSSWTELHRFAVDFNFLSGSLPPQYAAWGLMNALTLAYNSLSGTIPPAYGNMRSLVTFQVSANRLTGAIPQEILLCPLLSLFNVAINNLLGTIPTKCSASIQLFVIQNNSDLSGSLPPQMPLLSVAFTCGTAVTCPAQLLRYCLPQGSVFPAEPTDVMAILALTAGHEYVCASRLRRKNQTATSPVHYEGARLVPLAAITAMSSATYVAAIGGRLNGRVSIAGLQRASAALRLAAKCENAALDSVGEPMFSDLDENPLSARLATIVPPALEYAAGTAVINALLVCGVGVALHILRVLQQWSSSTPLRVPVLTTIMSLLPSAWLPGSLSIACGTLLQPSISACVALLASGDRTFGSCAVGAVMLCVWLALPVYCVHAVVVRGRRIDDGGSFVLAYVHSRGRNRGQQRADLLAEAVATLQACKKYLFTPVGEWRLQPRAFRGGRAANGTAARRHAEYLLDSMAPVFDAYTSRREWYFAVEWALAVVSAVVLGVLQTEASETADVACTMAQIGAGVALATTAMSTLLCVVLRPLGVRVEAYSAVAVGLLASLSSALLLGNEVAAAGVVVSVAAALEIAVMVLLMLCGVEGVVQTPLQFQAGQADAAQQVIPTKASTRNTATLCSDGSFTTGGDHINDTLALVLKQSESLAALVRLVCEGRATTGELP